MPFVVKTIALTVELETISNYRLAMGFSISVEKNEIRFEEKYFFSFFQVQIKVDSVPGTYSMRNPEHSRALRRHIGLVSHPKKMLQQWPLASDVAAQRMDLVLEIFGQLLVIMSLDLLLVVATMAMMKTGHALHPCPLHFREM